MTRSLSTAPWGPRRVSRSVRAVLLLAGLSWAWPTPAFPQVRVGVIAGNVRDSLGQAIAGAEISVQNTQVRTRTDQRGAFRLAYVPSGTSTVQARRLGFRMTTTDVAVMPDSVSSVDFQLQSVGVTLSTIVVKERRGRYSGRLAGFYERLESRTGGTFLTRERIDEGDPRNLTNVLQRVAGIEIVRGGRVRMRGRTCAPLVWIDGVAMPSGEADLNSFPPSSLEGIELYLTATGAPLRYQATVDRGRCGTILLWSRGPDTELRRRPAVASAAELEQRYADRSVFTAAEVDVPARPDSTAPFVVVYPPELFADGVRGSVVAELVVDSGGRAEEGTFGLVHSSHPLFARAVQDALRKATFHPALLGGRPVAQIVQIPIRFEPPGKVSSSTHR
jgi:TonB family protein